MNKSTGHRILDSVFFIWKMKVNKPLTENDNLKIFKFENTTISLVGKGEIDSKII